MKKTDFFAILTKRFYLILSAEIKMNQIESGMKGKREYWSEIVIN